LASAVIANNRLKQINIGKTIFTFAMGRKATYEFLHNNPAVESHPVDYVNNPAVIARNDKVVSINSALQIDLTGACNAEHLLGHQYSASGGQLDFVRRAYASRGGRSVIAVNSTAAYGKVSRIVHAHDPASENLSGGEQKARSPRVAVLQSLAKDARRDSPQMTFGAGNCCRGSWRI